MDVDGARSSSSSVDGESTTTYNSLTVEPSSGSSTKVRFCGPLYRSVLLTHPYSMSSLRNPRREALFRYILVTSCPRGVKSTVKGVIDTLHFLFSDLSRWFYFFLTWTNKKPQRFPDGCEWPRDWQWSGRSHRWRRRGIPFFNIDSLISKFQCFVHLSYLITHSYAMSQTLSFLLCLASALDRSCCRSIRTRRWVNNQIRFRWRSPTPLGTAMRKRRWEMCWEKWDWVWVSIYRLIAWYRFFSFSLSLPTTSLLS